MIWFCKSCRSINVQKQQLCHRCGFDIVRDSMKRDPYGVVHLFPKSGERWAHWTRRKYLAIHHHDGFVLYLTEDQAKDLGLIIMGGL